MQTIWVGRVRVVFRLQGTFQHTVGGGAICLNIITFYAQFNLENECLKFSPHVVKTVCIHLPRGQKLH
jgi:hypothetical protein